MMPAIPPRGASDFMKEDTKIVVVGRDPKGNHGIVNPPVYHASTILFPTVADYENVGKRRDAGERIVSYGRRGTPTTFALEDVVAEIEGGAGCALFPSGLAAIVATLLAFVKSGDHVLCVDTAYGPTRRTCDQVLKKFGVSTTYFDPLIGAGIRELIRKETRIVYVESPGTQTFEVQDIPAIAAEAHKAGCVVIMDNTWASPLYFKPFEHGVDVSIQAATKYIVGHSDAMLGTVTATKAHIDRVKSGHGDLGQAAAPDDCYLAQRGIRTLSVRLKQHWANGLKLAEWLQSRPEVLRVIHPALPSDPGHALWKRDFLGASGLFGVVLKPVAKAGVDALLNGLELYGMGASWGGYESLILPTHPETNRTATMWAPGGPTLRIHAGLEDVNDLIDDMKQGFDKMRRAAN
jgi:cystathionine beta-lyase